MDAPGFFLLVLFVILSVVTYMINWMGGITIYY